MACICSSNHEPDSFPDDEAINGLMKDEEVIVSAVNGSGKIISLSSAQLWENHSHGDFDSETDENDSGDEEEDGLYDSNSIPKLQFRNDMSRAQWNEHMLMAEVLQNKGKMATTTGVIREGKLFISVEETLFLSERGALSLMALGDTVSIRDLYDRISEEACGCSWEQFEAYRHLKSLGYIVGRQGVPWTIKRKKSLNLSSVHEAAFADNIPLNEGLEHDFSILALDDHTHSGKLNPDFDVYLPNSKFKKSTPGNPCFKLHVCRDRPPTKRDMEILESKCEGIPLKICHVDHGRVTFLSFQEAQLPELA
ncbi:unnamed protein product [Rhodiola kirilowii]